MTEMVRTNIEKLIFYLSLNLRICKIFILEIEGKGWKEENLHSWG